MTLSEWLAPDREVPQRERLLDIDNVQQRVQRYLGPVTLRVVRVKYRIGESLRVVFRAIGKDGCERLISARSHPASSSPRLASELPARAPEATRFPSAFEDDSLGAAFWIFPGDRALAGLDAMLQPGAGMRAHLGGRWQTTRLVSYVPEKGAVAAALDCEDRPIAFIKKYTSEIAARRAFAMHAAIAAQTRDGGTLCVPERLFVDCARHVTGVAAASGVRLADLGRRRMAPALRQLGSVVAELHGLRASEGVPQSTRATGESLRTAATLIASVRPCLKGSLARLMDALGSKVPVADHPVLLHGDLHLKNGLLDDGRLWLIDLDQAARGDAASDLGTVLAWLRAQATAGLMTTKDAAVCKTELLEGYAAGRPLPSGESLDWHTAAALVEQRALRAIARVRMHLLPHLDAIVADALALCPHGVAA